MFSERSGGGVSGDIASQAEECCRLLIQLGLSQVTARFLQPTNTPVG